MILYSLVVGLWLGLNFWMMPWHALQVGQARALTPLPQPKPETQTPESPTTPDSASMHVRRKAHVEHYSQPCIAAISSLNVLSERIYEDSELREILILDSMKGVGDSMSA
jgi:hypothetical protein